VTFKYDPLVGDPEERPAWHHHYLYDGDDDNVIEEVDASGNV